VTPNRIIKRENLRTAIAVLLAEQPAHKTKTMYFGFPETQSINPNRVQAFEVFNMKS
jgi:hypothetical protein